MASLARRIGSYACISNTSSQRCVHTRAAVDEGLRTSIWWKKLARGAAQKRRPCRNVNASSLLSPVFIMM